jgi:putative SOS response-associated peptidase YedK
MRQKNIRNRTYAVLRTYSQPMAFAGPWASFRWADGSVVGTFAIIITTSASAVMAKLPNGTPMTLELSGRPSWLGDGEADLGALLRPSADDAPRVWPVDRADM